MAYEQKNTLASLGAFILILIFYVVRLIMIINNHGMDATMMYNLWFWVIGLTIILTIIITVATHIASAVVQAVKDPTEEPEVDSTEDERDQIIKLKGTQTAYVISSMGGLAAMVSMVLGAEPLVMFNILLVTGLFATISSDLTKLTLYGRGF